MISPGFLTCQVDNPVPSGDTNYGPPGRGYDNSALHQNHICFHRWSNPKGLLSFAPSDPLKVHVMGTETYPGRQMRISNDLSCTFIQWKRSFGAILGFGCWWRTCQHAAPLLSGMEPMTFSCPSSSQEVLLKWRTMSNHRRGLGESRLFLMVWPFSEKHWQKNCNKVQMKSESRRKQGFIFCLSRLLVLYTLNTNRKKILVGGCESCCVLPVMRETARMLPLVWQNSTSFNVWIVFNVWRAKEHRHELLTVSVHLCKKYGMSWWKRERVWNGCSSRQDKTPSNNQTTARESYTSEDVLLRTQELFAETLKTGVVLLPSVGFLVAACLQTGNRTQHELLQLTNIQTPQTKKEPLSPEKHLRSSGAPLFLLEACSNQFNPRRPLLLLA